MKNTTRDNIIYLSVGLAVAALVAANFFYAFYHGTKAWKPSKFSIRAVYTTGLAVYFVARQVRREKATVAQVIGCGLLAAILHLLAVFTFRQAVAQLPGIEFMLYVSVEIAILVVLVPFIMPLIVSHTHRRSRGRRTHTPP